MILISILGSFKKEYDRLKLFIVAVIVQALQYCKIQICMCDKFYEWF